MLNAVTLRNKKLWTGYSNIWPHGVYNYDVGSGHRQRIEHCGTTLGANGDCGLLMKCELEWRTISFLAKNRYGEL